MTRRFDYAAVVARACYAELTGSIEQEVRQMPRVREIEDDGGDPILKKEFAKERELLGDVLNTTKIMAHCPPILRAVKALGAAISKSGQLPKGLVALVSLRVASINSCPF
jgi:alkylhydroperoxidase family enzyme